MRLHNRFERAVFGYVPCEPFIWEQGKSAVTTRGGLGTHNPAFRAPQAITSIAMTVPPDSKLLDALRENGLKGPRAAEMLQAAHEQLTGSGTRRGESCCYCCREALVSVLGRRTEPRLSQLWESIERAAGVRDDDPGTRTIPGVKFDDYSTAVKAAREEHGNRLKEVIRDRIGEEPVRRQGDIFAIWNELLKHLNRGLHNDATVEQAVGLYERTIQVMSTVFSPMSMRLEALDDLLGISNPGADEVSKLVPYATDRRHLNYFFENLAGIGWFKALRGDQHELLLPSQDGSSWSANPYLSMMIAGGQGDDIAEWLVGRVDGGSPQQVWWYINFASKLGPTGAQVALKGLERQGESPSVVEQVAVYLEGQAGIDSLSETAFEIVDKALNHVLPSHDDSYVLQSLVHSAVSAGQTLNAFDCAHVFVKKLKRHLDSDERPFEFLPPLERLSADMHTGSPTELLVAAVIELLDIARKQGIDLSRRMDLLDGLPETAATRIRSHHLLGEITNPNDRQQARRVALDHLVGIIKSSRPDPESLKLCRAFLAPGDDEVEVSAMLQALGEPPGPSAVAEHGEGPLPDQWTRAYSWLVAMPESVRAVWSEADAVITGKIGPPSEDGRLIGDVNVVSWGPRSPLPRDQLTEGRPEDVSARVAAWRPNDSDPWEYSARGLERELSEVIKEQPSEWSQRPVEIVAVLRHPTYIASYLSAMAEKATVVAENAPALVRATVVVASEPWPVEAIGGDKTFDFDPDWTIAAVAGVELIGKLWSIRAPMGDQAGSAWEVVQRAATNWSEDSFEDFDDSPLTAAINRPTTRALDVAFSYAGMHVDGGGPIPDEFLKVLELALDRTGRDGLQARAIIARRLPFLRAQASEWFSRCISLLIGDKAPDQLGQKTFDLYLEWGRPDKQFMEDFGDHYMDALNRVPAHALGHILLGMVWRTVRWGDVASLVKVLDAEHVSSAGEILGRWMYDNDNDNDDADLTGRATDFWEAALGANLDPGAYAGFGSMADASSIEDDRLLDLLDRTVAKAQGRLDWGYRVAERAAQSPTDRRALRIIAALLNAEVDLMHVRGIGQVGLDVLRDSSVIGGLDDSPERRMLRERLLEAGFNEAKDLN